MPETFKVTVWDDAQAEASNTSEAITTASRILIVFITTLLGRNSVKELGYVRIHKRNENENRNYPKYDFANTASPWHCAHFTQLAGLRWSEDPSARKEQSYERASDKKRTIWFEQREVSNPRAAQAESNQDQRPQAARRSQDGGQTSDKKRSRASLVGAASASFNSHLGFSSSLLFVSLKIGQ